MADHPHITVYDGKYTLILDPSNLRALRHGEPWRDLVGDGFVMALGQEIVELRERLAVHEANDKSTLLDKVYEAEHKLRQAQEAYVRAHGFRSVCFGAHWYWRIQDKDYQVLMSLNAAVDHVRMNLDTVGVSQEDDRS